MRTRGNRELIAKEKEKLFDTIRQEIWEYLYLKTGQVDDEPADEEAQLLVRGLKQSLKTVEKLYEYMDKMKEKKNEA